MSDENVRTEEPSLEDILSSIRKILSESDDDHPDDHPEALPVTAASDPGSVPGAADVRPVQAFEPKPSSASERKRAAASDVSAAVEPVFAEPEEDDILELTEDMAVTETTPSTDRLVSSDTEALAGGMLADLASQIARERHVAVGNGAMTLEALLRDVLRELLREWLDTNLPAMTERLVQKEIERLVDRAENA